MSNRPMDIDRAVDIARDPESVTKRDRADAFFWSSRRLDVDEEDDTDLTHIERRRLAEVRHKLAIFERHYGRTLSYDQRSA